MKKVIFVFLCLLVHKKGITQENINQKKVDQNSLLQPSLPDPQKLNQKPKSTDISPNKSQNDVKVDTKKRVDKPLKANPAAKPKSNISKNNIPVEAPAQSSSIQPVKEQAPKPALLTHTVKQGETAYSIARSYGMTVEQLLKQNNMPSPSLQIGKVLNITAGGEAKKDTTKKVSAKPLPRQAPYVSNSVGRMYDKGVAVVIETNRPIGKYLALSNDAPIGSKIQVKNLANNRHVNAKVIGKLNPLIGQNVIVQLSVTAFDLLGAKDRQCGVEVNYLKGK